MKLSFCIPTRNRAHMIGDTLDSIIKEKNNQIEIVIVDGASEDDTEDIVKNYKEKFYNLVYYRRNSCVGVDRDISKAVQLSSGDYSWLISDDDILIPGSIEYILTYLKKYPDSAGLTTNYIQYDNKLLFPVHTYPASHGNKLKGNKIYNNREDAFSSIGLHMSYISTAVVNTNLWKKVVSEKNLGKYENEWLMSYIQGQMINNDNIWHYIDRPCIIQRTGNDSFTARVGVYKRQLIAHVAYSDTIAGLFGRKSKTYNLIFYSLLNDRLPRIFANLKSQNIPIQIQYSLFKLYFNIYGHYLGFWLKIFPLFFIPNFVFRYLKLIYFKVKRNNNKYIAK